jgi:hypothetical protein
MCLNFFSSVLKIMAPARSRAGKKIFDQADANVVAHSLELFIYIINVFKVIDELCDKRSIGQCEELRIL